MFIRFALPYVHCDTHRAVGVFRGAYWIHLDGHLDQGDSAWLMEELDWFDSNLPLPRVAVDPRAVFWFRPDAGAPLSRIWAVVRLVEDNGVPVHVYRTRRPGIVVYRDDYQIAARPWRDSFETRTRSH